LDYLGYFISIVGITLLAFGAEIKRGGDLVSWWGIKEIVLFGQAYNAKN
jgi:hypothetical protein